MMGNAYVLFCTIFFVIVLFEYDLSTKNHIICEVPDNQLKYTDLFCMSKTENLLTSGDGAYLKNYGRWQYYIFIQVFIAAICCRMDLKMRQLKSEEENSTIGKRYILASCILLGVIVCWTLSYLSMGGYFNIFIGRLMYHAIDIRTLPSPIATVFPRRAQCLVETPSSNKTFTTTCELPLNVTAPFYFIILFAAYLISLLWTLNLIGELAWEKILETRQQRLRELETPDMGEIEEAKADALLTMVAEKLKMWTKPPTSSSMKAPLIHNLV